MSFVMRQGVLARPVDVALRGARTAVAALPGKAYLLRQAEMTGKADSEQPLEHNLQVKAASLRQGSDPSNICEAIRGNDDESNQTISGRDDSGRSRPGLRRI